MDIFLQQCINGLALGGTYALIALGLSLVFSILGLINFAHGELLTITGYSMAGAVALGFPLPVAIVAGILAAGLAAILMELIAFRPMRGASPMVMILTSFAISAILQTLFQALISPRAVPVPVPAALMQVVSLGPVDAGALQVLSIVLSLVGLSLLTWLYYRSRMGAALRAAAEDFETVKLMGMNSNWLISVSFALSGVLAGIAGVLWVFQRGSVDPMMGSIPLLWSFIAVVIGGLGSLSGAVAGGFLLGFLEVLLRAILPSEVLPYREAIELLILISVLFARPSGLIPRVVNVR